MFFLYLFVLTRQQQSSQLAYSLGFRMYACSQLGSPMIIGLNMNPERKMYAQTSFSECGEFVSTRNELVTRDAVPPMSLWVCVILLSSLRVCSFKIKFIEQILQTFFTRRFTVGFGSLNKFYFITLHFQVVSVLRLVSASLIFHRFDPKNSFSAKFGCSASMYSILSFLLHNSLVFRS